MKILILVFLFIILHLNSCNKQGQTSRFDRHYRDCGNGQCQFRVNDDACVYKWMDSGCYEKIYGNYLLEFGEVNNELKKEFENCFNAKYKNRGWFIYYFLV